MNYKFALFGHGPNLCNAISFLIEGGFPKPVVITHERTHHERDLSIFAKEKKLYQDVFDVCSIFDVDIIDPDTLNSADVLDFLRKNSCNIGFSFSCRSIIGNEIIEHFKGKIFNIHPSYLPQERGAGLFSWRILKNSNEVSGTIHYVDQEIDTGNIVLQKKTICTVEFPFPKDYLIETISLFDELFKDFLDNLSLYLRNQGIKQDKSKSSYYHRLITEVHGFIDWSQQGVHIERLIRAFSYPYPGARTFLNGQKAVIFEAKFVPFEHHPHPFMYGKVFEFEKDYAKVIVKDGHLLISKVHLESNKEVLLKNIKPSISFHSDFLSMINANKPISLKNYSNQKK